MTMQEFVTSDMAVLTETGDSWFNALRLRLPPGCGFEIQLRYGSIGWSVGATLGYALAAAADGKRLLSMIGDGSFQVTAQVGSVEPCFQVCLYAGMAFWHVCLEHGVSHASMLLLT